MESNKKFYSNLPVLHLSLNQLLESPNDFSSIPENWYLVMTDIVNSTEHFQAEHYQEINLIAVSSISVVLNIARKNRVTVPFIYGGDGATLIVPPEIVENCKSRLATLRSNTKKRFNMDLRVSIIPMSAVLEAGFSVRVAKLYISDNYRQAIFLGDGIRYATSLMKHSSDYDLPSNVKQKPIDLSGLECKWNALFPPRQEDEVLCLIVAPMGAKEPEEIFQKVLDKIEDIYGSFEERHPIHPKTLSPTTHWKTIIHASHLRYGRIKLRYILKHLVGGIFKDMHLSIKVLWHHISKEGALDMSTCSDTLKIDNTLQTIFVGLPQKRSVLEAFLKEEEEKGELVYGIHISSASVMTCYIKESQKTHMRFLDGFGGGYTLAAVEMKKKLKAHNMK